MADTYVKVKHINIVPKNGTYYYDDIVDPSKHVIAQPIDYTKIVPKGGKYLGCVKCGGMFLIGIKYMDQWKYCPYCGRILIK